MSERSSLPYSKHTFDVLGKPNTERGLVAYAQVFGFENAQALLDAMPYEAEILDAGSGYGFLAREAALFGRNDLHIHSLNPSLTFADPKDQQFPQRTVKTHGDDKFRQAYQILSRDRMSGITDLDLRIANALHNRRAVVGLGENLPYKNNLFKRIFEYRGPVYYDVTSEFAFAKGVIGEYLRVLQPKGEASVVLVDMKHGNKIREIAQKFPNLVFTQEPKQVATQFSEPCCVLSFAKKS